MSDEEDQYDEEHDDENFTDLDEVTELEQELDIGSEEDETLSMDDFSPEDIDGEKEAIQMSRQWYKRIEIDLWATAYRFRPGHCLRLQVSSGAHPRWARNLGTDEPLDTGVRMVKAAQTIYHDRARPSALVLPVENMDVMAKK